jgi:uncharacterized membrane protein YqaE (UPF0057 family)
MLLAIIFPCISFLVRGKIFSAILCLILQITLIGWLPAAIWAGMSLNNDRAEKRTNKILKEMNKDRY